MKWPMVTLGSICRVTPGFAFKSSGFTNDGIPVVKIANIRDDYSVDCSDAQCWPQDSFSERLRKYVLKDKDIVIAMTGATAGKIGRVHTSQDLLLNQRVAKIEAVEADPDFIWCALSSRRYRELFFSIAGGAAQPNMSGGQIEAVEVPFPPHTVQKRIASILSAYDDLIENNRRRMVLLEESARLLYREWFVRLRFPGHEHTRITNGVPEGWGLRVLGDLCTDIRESVKPDSLEPDTAYIGLEHMPRRSISLYEWGKAEEVTSSKFRFKEGDILFGKIRPYFHKVGIAFTDGVASSDAIVIRPLEYKLTGFVLMTVSSDRFVAITAQTMREGSKMPRADWKQMKQYITPLPPDGLLNAFEGFVCLIISQLKTLTYVNNKLRAARDLLLPKLMSGEIAV